MKLTKVNSTWLLGIIILLFIAGSLIISIRSENHKEMKDKNQKEKNMISESQPQSTDEKVGVQAPRPNASTPQKYSSGVIQIKFKKGFDIDPPEALLPPDLRNSVNSITNLFSLSEDELKEMDADDLKQWFQITLKPGVDATVFIKKLRRLDSVNSAQHVPKPPPLPE